MASSLLLGRNHTGHLRNELGDTEEIDKEVDASGLPHQCSIIIKKRWVDFSVEIKGEKFYAAGRWRQPV
jgi:hypothetical protein